MALYKRKTIYWVNIRHNGERIQRSTGTSDKLAAQEFHDKIKAELWHQSKLKHKPKKFWIDAAVKWVNDSQHKKSLHTDIFHLRWLNKYLKDKMLNDIDQQLIEKLANIKASTGVSNARVNRMLALIRAILNRAVSQWGWLDSAPKITMRKESNSRTRWLTHDQAKALIEALPPHLADMAVFTLATGLRQSNVLNLKWEAIDLNNHQAWIHADQAKGNKAIAVPLNEDAMAILNKCKNQHRVYVFTYQNQRIKNVGSRTWKAAIERAGIEDFRWHDLRHTWASWHVQNGTSLQELQTLGGWSCYNMVLRYAHLSSSHLQAAASRIMVTNWLHGEKKGNERQKCEHLNVL